jgi:BNR/Asp-box repeat
MRAVSVAALALLIVGCGSDGSESGSSLVDPGNPPPINSLELDPGGDALLLTTNRGFYRVEDGEATRVSAEVTTPDGQSPVGTFLAVASTEDGELIGSGHPDEKRKLAPFLGLLRSPDDGKSWEVVSRYGLADLHVMRPAHGMLYAYDAVLPAVIVSPDEGKTWDERGAPPDRVLDLVVDPEDPDHLLASTENAIFRSTDGGETWSSASGAAAARLEWPESEALYRADKDGLVYLSDDHGASWQQAGKIDGEPWKLRSDASGQLYAALSDATVLRSADGGESWEEHFRP